MTDTELVTIRVGMPKYLNDMTGKQQSISQAVYAEQKRRYDLKKEVEYLEYNQTVEKAGYKIGDKVSNFVPSWTGCGGELITGKVGFRKKYFVQLDRPLNGKKSAHLTKAWRIELCFGSILEAQETAST